MTSILERIAQRKFEEVAAAKKLHPEQSLKVSALGRRDFIAALQDTSTPAVIAEIKKASPSKGLIRADFDVAKLAKAYASHHARCLSVLTDRDFFQGHPDYIDQAKQACPLPVLRKDFIVDPYQIYESKALGADCILLIVALLDDKQLADYNTLALELGLAVLVESHTEAELQRALALPQALIGINNRNLHTFETDIQLSIALQPQVPSDRILVTESGINTRDDIKRMQAHGINTFLIGESLMRSDDVGKALSDLIEDYSPSGSGLSKGSGSGDAGNSGS